MTGTTETIKLNAVIGFPLGHSLSPTLHNHIYEQEGIEAQMRAVANENILELVAMIRFTPFNLVAVTIPHKQTIIPLLDEVDNVAREIGAVNTVINRQGKLFGYNTDIVGIERTLNSALLKNKNVLLVGAGGVAQPIAYYITKCGGKLLCANRDKKSTLSLVKKFSGQAVDLDQLDTKDIDVIINATPLGMKGDLVDLLPVPEKLISSNQVVFDCVYNPLQTKLLQLARLRGAKTISGLEMFVAQGLAQEELWLERALTPYDYRSYLEVNLITLNYKTPHFVIPSEDSHPTRDLHYGENWPTG
ncbi:MAG: shikimate dehydrogenase [Candidatus Magasanikbacteria bacterium RIFOXYD2_FULL_41_14]|uniref:Shikimate dehydrogenase (NADP(+)) n=1 Tax=Candidatus Magasanikbacteria bacterium RIFOXYD2_FULL_41_14 TaxID=1798709 RepID=A0A1F6PCZ9_9BACT|nr:MAG: shikimate dehydrogenase [Candidatus Magasanikbacteria bacterium RIFOXYD2_FULL_41_14]